MSPLVIQLYLDFWCWHPHNLLVKSLPSLDLRCWMGGANLVFGDLAARSTAQLFVNVEAGSFSRWFSPFFRVTFHIFAGDIQASCCSSAHFCRSAWFFSGIITGMEVSWNGVGYPPIIHFPRIFQHKNIHLLGYRHFSKTRFSCSWPVPVSLAPLEDHKWFTSRWYPHLLISHDS